MGPPTAEMWQHLGAVRELDQSFAKAIDAYTQWPGTFAERRPAPQSPRWTYVNAQQFEKAKGDFLAAIRTAADNAEAHAGLGFVLAELGQEDTARQEASTALLVAADNQLVLHNVACIYGRLSATKPQRRIEYENLALTSLQRATSNSRQNFIGLDADEVTLIRKETSFPASLKARSEFQQLINEYPSRKVE